MSVDSTKDYYAILGVLPSIDATALRAVYLALLKKYHPDVYKGEKTEADRITKDINEAYETLGNPEKRSEYDKNRRQEIFGNFEDQPDSQKEYSEFYDKEIEHDWATIISFYSGAKLKYDYLRKISKSLAETFKIILINGRLGHYFEITGEIMLREYLSRYFGTNIHIQNLALDLLNRERKKEALDLNKLIRVLGTPPEDDVQDFLQKFKQRNGLYPTTLEIIRSEILNIAVYTDASTKERYYYATLFGGNVIGHTIDKMIFTPAAYYRFSSIQTYREAIEGKFKNFKEISLDNFYIDDFIQQIALQPTIKNFDLSNRYNFK